MTANSSRPTTSRSRNQQGKKLSRGATKSTPQDNSRLIAYASLGITVLLNIGSVGYIYGNTSTRLSIVETRIEKFEEKLDAMQAVRIEMAGMKEQLSSINAVLQRLEKQVTSRGAN